MFYFNKGSYNITMRITILKGQDPRHNFFAQKIRTIENIETQVLTHKREDKSRLKKMLLKSPKTFFNRVSKYLVYSFTKWNKKERDFFGSNIIENEKIVQNYNNEETIQLIRDFKPDVIAVFGTPIIVKDILEIPRYGAINLHGGISPEYKGGNTIFWALFNNDLEKVGATIHYMAEKVDSGEVLAKVYPDLNSQDDEFSASAKTFKYATEEFLEIIKWIKTNNKQARGEGQHGKGNLYLAKDRTLLKEFQGINRIKNNLKNAQLKKRLEKFYA